jgi:hypothetical protein
LAESSVVKGPQRYDAASLTGVSDLPDIRDALYGCRRFKVQSGPPEPNQPSLPPLQPVALRQRATGRVELLTDQKSSYATLAREVFGGDVSHAATP